MAKKNASASSSSSNMRNVIFENLNFAAREAYKLLRTNLMFSFGDTQRCKIVGITSAGRGEAKSTTSANLAYTFAETGKKVLLIDADMRLPTIAKKIGMKSAPGLSEKLAGLATGNEILRRHETMMNFYIIPAGSTPPNPSELLASESMHHMLESLAQQFDFIVIDLPPVNIVSDALAVSPWIDGLVVAVRQNSTTRQEINACMNQLRILGSKVLGFVMTDVDVTAGKYSKYSKYGKTYGYGYGYEKAGKPSNDTNDNAEA